MKEVRHLQGRLYREYAQSVGLESHAQYMHGTPLRPVVPLDTAIDGVMIVGAYPSARFATIAGDRDVPVADNLGPFETERWFDGSRVREQPSAAELEELVLAPLELPRTLCWITDLVKVFLFKPGHRKKYERLGATVPAGYMREQFEELGERSLPWLEEEVAVARPRLLLTLGREVAGIVRGVKGDKARNRLLGAPVEPVRFGSVEVPTAHLAHPGILMRPTGKHWKRAHLEERVPLLRRFMRAEGLGRRSARRASPIWRTREQSHEDYVRRVCAWAPVDPTDWRFQSGNQAFRARSQWRPP
ncbi:MAG TPA: hypothetical protein ENK57_22765 [Polyangiaceae bacterium]|nr:hypothetical protein [Polyangiaceae bacterium]